MFCRPVGRQSPARVLWCFSGAGLAARRARCGLAARDACRTPPPPWRPCAEACVVRRQGSCTGSPSRPRSRAGIRRGAWALLGTGAAAMAHRAGAWRLSPRAERPPQAGRQAAAPAGPHSQAEATRRPVDRGGEQMTTGKRRRAAGTRYVSCPTGSLRPPGPLRAGTPCGRSAQPSASTSWNPGGTGRVGFTSADGGAA